MLKSAQILNIALKLKHYGIPPLLSLQQSRLFLCVRRCMVTTYRDTATGVRKHTQKEGHETCAKSTSLHILYHLYHLKIFVALKKNGVAIITVHFLSIFVKLLE